MTPQELLHEHGIKLGNYGPGQHYATCPQCSKDRKKSGNKCLGVLIEPGGKIIWNCHHCSWSGPPKGSGARTSDADLISYVYRDSAGIVRFRKVRNRPGKEPRFWLEQPDGRGGWKTGTKGVDTNIIYRADEVADAIKAGRGICIVEGEKDADNLWRLDIPATCNAHGAHDPTKKQKPKWRNAHSEQLRGAALVVFNDNDPPGYEHADAACELSLGVAKRVRRLDLKDHWPEIPTDGDVSDWLAAGGEHTPEQLRGLIEAASDYRAADNKETNADAPVDDDVELERLARLPRLEYERARGAAAKALGVRSTMLDRLVKAKRTELGLDDEEGGKQGRAIAFAEVEPWPEPVDGACLLDELVETIGSYVIMPAAAKLATALWVFHTYLLNVSFISPRLAIRSPTKQCGKTTLIDVLSHLVAKALRTDSVTPSALFRVVAAHRPTLLIDEADAFARDDDELRGILNSGHRQGGHVLRNVGDEHEPRAFGTFGAVAIATIGTLPATLIDRSVIVDLKRRLPSEAITPFRLDRTEALDVLARKIARWTKDHADAVAALDPVMPPGVVNRAADNWRPLAAIADVIAGEWPVRTRKAMLAGNPETIEEASQIELLLGDIRGIFDAAEGKPDWISSAEIIEHLVEITPRPWAEYGRGGKPITPNKLARLLKPLGVAPHRLEQGDDRARGYFRTLFDDAFDRYLAPKEAGSMCPPVHKPSKSGTSRNSQSVRAQNLRTDAKMQERNIHRIADGWTH